MSALTFKAVIGGVHFNPKKGTVKIELEAASYVSLDDLTTLGPQDESIRVTLESEQTRIGQLDPPLSITLDEEAAKKLEEAARLLRDGTGIDQGEEPGDEEKLLAHDETPDPEGADIEE